LHQVCHTLGLSTRIVPHQLRHTYATEMLRAGVSFPVLMKLLGHSSPDMTMRYVDVALTDLQREYQLARSRPPASCPSAECAVHPHSSRTPGSNRFLARGSTCARDVPPRAATWPLPRLPRPPIQPAHQDCQPNAQTPNPLRVGRDWPVMSANPKLAP
jgi:hypothetical protein